MAGTILPMKRTQYLVFTRVSSSFQKTILPKPNDHSIWVTKAAHLNSSMSKQIIINLYSSMCVDSNLTTVPHIQCLVFFQNIKCKDSYNKYCFEGWRDGSVVKSTDCSSWGPEFKSQQPHGDSQPSVIESDALFWCVWRQQQCTHKYNK